MPVKGYFLVNKYPEKRTYKSELKGKMRNKNIYPNVTLKV